jgi:hypothetical protein
MRKMTLATGLAIGYLAGSRFGPAPARQVAAGLEGLEGKPKVGGAAAQAGRLLRGALDDAPEQPPSDGS